MASADRVRGVRHQVMELCTGGELFDQIIAEQHFTEAKAARVVRCVVLTTACVGRAAT